MEPAFDAFLYALRSAEPLLLNGLAFALGLWGGHHFALGRDKRQEFNAAVAPIRAQLIKDIANAAWWVTIPSAVELDSFIHLMPWWRRRRLHGAIAAYGRAHTEQERCDDSGGRYYADTSPIKAAGRRVLALLGQR